MSALRDNEGMTGIQFVTDSGGRKVAVLIDLKKLGARLQDLGMDCFRSHEEKKRASRLLR